MSSGNDHSGTGDNQSNDINSGHIHHSQGMGMVEYNSNNPRPILGQGVLPQPNQRRPPQNLQDVLRYSIAATTENIPTAIPPMDNERRAFLEASLRSFTSSAVDRMSVCIEGLLATDNLHDMSSREGALEQIIDLVDNMDNASDFYKIGGFRVIDSGLHSPHSNLRAKTATLLAELSQNNLFIQDRILETNFLSMLLNMVDTDPDPNVQIKSFYAVSCIVRDHEMALRAFTAQNGWTVLLRALQSSLEKLQLKASFLLSSLCAQSPAVINELCDLGYVEQLCGLLAEVSPCPLVEHLLQALLSMATNNEQVVKMCALPKFQLRRTLANIFETTERDMDDFQYAQQLKTLVFGASFEDDGER